MSNAMVVEVKKAMDSYTQRHSRPIDLGAFSSVRLESGVNAIEPFIGDHREGLAGLVLYGNLGIAFSSRSVGPTWPRSARPRTLVPPAIPDRFPMGIGYQPCSFSHISRS